MFAAGRLCFVTALRYSNSGGANASNQVGDIAMISLRDIALSVSLTALAAAPLFAQEIPIEGPVPTTALVNAESKSAAPLDPAMLKLEVNGHQSAITAVTPIRPGATQIAILIDDGVRGSFALQLKDIQKFLGELPAGAKVMVGYMQNGEVRSTSKGFSADHAAVATELRVPMSSPGISASPYFCLSEFVKHWPSNEAGPRFVLMITNGVDPYNGRASILNQDSPYVQEAQNNAQRAGVAVYSIYYGDAGVRGGGAYQSGQSYLQQIGDATGGQLLSGGITPVSFAPFLDQFRKRMAESYTVGFMASANHEKPDTLTQIKLKTSQSGVKLHAPDAVHPGVTEAQ
jgi:hypothetical protein